MRSYNTHIEDFKLFYKPLHFVHVVRILNFEMWTTWRVAHQVGDSYQWGLIAILSNGNVKGKLRMDLICLRFTLFNQTHLSPLVELSVSIPVWSFNTNWSFVTEKDGCVCFIPYNQFASAFQFFFLIVNSQVPFNPVEVEIWFLFNVWYGCLSPKEVWCHVK